MIQISQDNQQADIILQCQQFDMQKHFNFATSDDLSNKEAYCEFKTSTGSYLENAATITNDHIITIEVDPNISWKVGTYTFNIVTYDIGKSNRLAYPAMKLKVNVSANPNADAEAIEGISDVFNKLKAELNDYIGQVSGAVSDCATAVSNAEVATANCNEVYERWKDTTVVGELDDRIAAVEVKTSDMDVWKTQVLEGSTVITVEEG